jgi:hypothetical protein
MASGVPEEVTVVSVISASFRTFLRTRDCGTRGPETGQNGANSSPGDAKASRYLGVGEARIDEGGDLGFSGHRSLNVEGAAQGRPFALFIPCPEM